MAGGPILKPVRGGGGQGNKVGYGPRPMRGAVYVSPKMYRTILLSSGLLIFANCIRWYVNFYHDVAILFLLLYISQFFTQLHGGRPPFVFPICLGDATGGGKKRRGRGGFILLHASMPSQAGQGHIEAKPLPSSFLNHTFFFLSLLFRVGAFAAGISAHNNSNNKHSSDAFRSGARFVGFPIGESSFGFGPALLGDRRRMSPFPPSVSRTVSSSSPSAFGPPLRGGRTGESDK